MPLLVLGGEKSGGDFLTWEATLVARSAKDLLNRARWVRDLLEESSDGRDA
jgi:hypothetical protein